MIFKKIKFFKQHDVSVLLTGVIILLVSLFTVSYSQDHLQDNCAQITQILPYTSPQDSIKNLLVQEADNYIQQNFPKSKLTGSALVEACVIKHDFDICFAMAQAEIESGYGSAGKARKTNSPWNVGAWDGRSVQTMNKMGHSYSHPDQSIEPYIELVKTKYLGIKRTIDDLMKRYVTLNGKRYASDPNYERKLSKTYQKICKNTVLYSLQEQYRSIDL